MFSLSVTESKLKGAQSRRATVVTPVPVQSPDDRARVGPDGAMLSWDFSKIPVFPPAGAERSQIPSYRSRPPIFGFLQAKLKVGAVNDPLVHEADRAAAQVMRTADPAFSVQAASHQLSRKCAQCEEEDAKSLQMKTAGSAPPNTGEAPPIVYEVLRLPGQPLDPATRSFFEPRFGRSFNEVQVHTSAHAARSARSLGAHAYTVGSQIVFAEGRYEPRADDGKMLLAHELAHVVQQSDRGNFGVPAAADDSARPLEVHREPDRSNASAADPEIEAVLLAARRARQAPDDQTRMMLSASEMVYHLVTVYFPGEADKISGVGYDPKLPGAHGRKSGTNIEISVGRDFVLDVDQDGVIKPTIKLRQMFREIDPSAGPGTGHHGLISDMRSASQAADKAAPTAAEQAAYQQALADHKEQQEGVNQLLENFSGVPRSKAVNQVDLGTKTHAYAATLLQNTLEWFPTPGADPSRSPPLVDLLVLTPTHDFRERQKGKYAYFDIHVAYPNVGGTYKLSPPTDGADDPGVVYRDSATLLGEAHAIRVLGRLSTTEGAKSSVIIFLDRGQKLTMEQLSRTLEHETQHIADQSPAVAQLDLEGAKARYKTEFRAYWIETAVTDQICFPSMADPSSAICRPAQPQNMSGLILGGSQDSRLPDFGSPNGKAVPGTVKGSDVQNKQTCTVCDSDINRQEVVTQFQNERQQKIFEHLITAYPRDKFDCFYVCSQPFRNMVHTMAAPKGAEGQNTVNSIRIEALIEAVNQCSPTLAATEPRLTLVREATERLDAVDKSFLKDPVQSKPFWDATKLRLPHL